MNKTDSILRRVSRFAPVKRFIFGIIFIMLGLSLYGQTTYPVQVFTQLTPPYTPYLPAYYSGINQKLKVTLINTDMKQPLLSVFLRMKIKSSSFTIETPENVYTERIELQAGVPMQLSLNDLTSYFKNENMRISGGRNEFLRTNMLPDNFYRFNFEVYEANTGRLLSNPKLGFAQAMIASGEPPVLNLPLKGTTIMESNIPAIMFSWTPRHMNSVASAYGTEYEFTLVEIYDKQIAPEAAFDFSRVLYTETVRSTSFIHTVAQPQLIPGLRYAWRVRAVAREGVEEANVFKNNGFSPVFWFDYTVDCKPVQFDKVEVKDRVAIISWQQSDAVGYDVQYRKKGSNKWYTGALEDNETCPVYNLKFGEEYEYRIGVRCTMNDAFTYSQPKGFSMPEELAKSTNCGILPNINVSNQTPARELQAKLPILVGDFPVFITKVSGSGRFTGEGYIGIPYLKNAKIAVTFKDIVVNTDNRMIGGFIETKYDISSGKNLLWDVDETLTGGKGVGDEVVTYNLDYAIDSNVTGKYQYVDTSKDEIKEGEDYQLAKGENGYYIITLTDTDGNKHDLKVDSLPAMIKDKDGNVYEVKKKDGEENEVELSEVVTSTEASNNSVAFRIRNNIYNNGSKFTMLISAAIPDIQITTQDSIKLDSLNYYFEGRNNLNVQLQKDSISPDSIKYYLKLSDYSTNLKNGSKVVVKKGNNKVSELKIETYDAPYVKFDIGNNFNGEYFFDKGFETHSTLKTPVYYDTIHVKGNVYYSPVLGLRVGGNATIKISIEDFTDKIKNDSEFGLKLKASEFGKITIGGQADSISFTGRELDSLRILRDLTIISRTDISGQNIVPIFIDVFVEQTGEKVGRLEYYSATMQQRNVTLIYPRFVNQNNLPTNVVPANLQDFLRNNSINQLFVQLTIDSLSYNSRFRTTDLTSETSSSAIFRRLRTEAVDSIPNFRRTFSSTMNDFYFITDLLVSSGGGYLGGAHNPGTQGGIGVKNMSNNETDNELIAHELGHWLGLPHTFEDGEYNNEGIRVKIHNNKAGSDKNFMDYNMPRRRKWLRIQLRNTKR